MALERSLARNTVTGRAAARLAKQVEVALADLELSLPQYRALAFLSSGGLAPTDLAGRLAVSKPSITALIDGLVARGYVARVPDEHDRRRVEHRLTAEGTAALGRADDAVGDRLDHLLHHLSADDARRAAEGLALWNEALNAARGSGR